MATTDDWFHATGGQFNDIGFTAWSAPPNNRPLAFGVWGLGARYGVSGLIDDGSSLPSNVVPAADSYATKAGVLGAANTDTGVAGIGNGVGVFGQNGSAPGLSTGRRCGVLGASVSATGVVGESLDGNGVLGTTGRNPPTPGLFAAGVVGAGSRDIGVFGISNNGIAVRGDANGDSGTGIFAVADGPNGIAVQAQATALTGKAGDFIGGVHISQSLFVQDSVRVGPTVGGGNVMVSGAVIAGTVTATVKNAIVAFPDGTTRVLHCMESPEHWFEDFGTARLKRGRAVVKLDADFAKTIKAGDYRVFLTPEGDCGGLYIRNRRSATFEVRELQGGTSSVAFSYRIVGRRKDIKKHRRFAKLVTEPPVAPATRTLSSVDALLAKVRKRKRVAAKPARAPQRLSKLLARVRKQAHANFARKDKRAKRA